MRPILANDESYTGPQRLNTRTRFWNEHGTNTTPLTTWLWQQLQRTVGDIVARPCTYLDAGCGGGDKTEALASRLPRGSHVTAVDASPGMVAAARERLAAVAVQADVQVAKVEALPFPDGAFDLVTAIHVMHHVADLPSATAELARVARVAAVVTGSFDPDEGLNRLHYNAVRGLGLPEFMAAEEEYRRYSPTAAEELLRGAFPSVSRLEFHNDAVCTSTEPLLAYYRTAILYRHTSGVNDARVPDGAWAQLESDVAHQLGEHLAAHGSFTVPGRVALFVCGGS